MSISRLACMGTPETALKLAMTLATPAATATLKGSRYTLWSRWTEMSVVL